MNLQPGMAEKPNFDHGAAEPMILAAKQRFVGDILVKRSRFTPDRIALEWGNKQWTFKELNTDVNKLANSIVKTVGVKRGDRLAVISQNRAEYSRMFYVASKTGIILSPMNWRNVGMDLVDALNVVEPSTVMISDEFLPNLLEVLDRLPYVEKVIFMDKGQAINLPTYYYDELMANGDENEPVVYRHDEDALYTIYTSGTTGIQKAAILSQRAAAQRVIANLATYPRITGLDQDDCCVNRGPYFHATSPDEMFATHAMGGKCIVLAGWNPADMADILEKNKIAWLSLSPGMYLKLIDEIKSRGPEYKVKGVRCVGSMPELSPGHELRELSLTLNSPILNTFGSTEAGYLLVTQDVLPIGSEEYRGKVEAIFCADSRLVDDDGNEVPDGTPGELVSRSTMMFSGYWNNPEENAKVFKEGWYASGDVMVRNPDGSLSYVSRKKYMIKSGAENVYPAEIERVLFAHPQVTEACVVGAKHVKWGETPIAFVSTNGDVTPEELKEFCKANMARYRVPNVIDIVAYEDFPRNTTGKIMRNLVEEWIPRIEHKIV